MEPVPASSKKDIPLDKVEPIWERETSLRSSGISWWRSGKTAVQNSQQRSESMWEKQTYRHQGQSRSRGDAPGSGHQRFPWSLREDHGEARCSSLTHEGPRWSGYPPAAHGGSLSEASEGAHGGGCDCVEITHWSRLLEEPVALWREEPVLGQFYWQDLWPHGECVLEQGAPEGWTAWKAPMLDQIRKSCSPL